MTDLIKKISLYGIVPVIQIENLEDAVPLAKALCQGGLPVAEVTFRTPCAAEAIKLMKQAYPDMLIGAGTVLNPAQVDQAIAAGSEFIVSPGFNPTTVQYCLDKNIPIIPGTSTPSDMEKAIEMGLDFVKFFPTEANGGLPAIKAMSAPYNQLKFMPTGGINLNNLHDYLAFNKIIACGGSWMVTPNLLNNKDFETIEEYTRQAVQHMLDIRLDNVELSSNNELQTKLSKNILNQVLGEKNQQIIVSHDKSIQTTLVLTTSRVDRLIHFLTQKGLEFDHSSIITNKEGKIVSIDLITDTDYRYRFIMKGAQ